MRFVSFRVRSAIVMHGYSTENSEIIEAVHEDTFVEKLIAVERIQSISEKYILVTSSHGRMMYWEYEGGLDTAKLSLAAAGLFNP